MLRLSSHPFSLPLNLWSNVCSWSTGSLRESSSKSHSTWHWRIGGCLQPLPVGGYNHQFSDASAVAWVKLWGSNNKASRETQHVNISGPVASHTYWAYGLPSRYGLPSPYGLKPLGSSSLRRLGMFGHQLRCLNWKRRENNHNAPFHYPMMVGNFLARYRGASKNVFCTHWSKVELCLWSLSSFSECEYYVCLIRLLSYGR